MFIISHISSLLKDLFPDQISDHLIDPLHLRYISQPAFYKREQTLELVTSMQPLTEDAQEYLLAFRHLGMITSYPRWVLVFYKKLEV